ncbi:MAG TPA: hypothetical protein DGD08_04765 [Gemmatimonas aurantiaca]|uniref:Uncharacterized protein n=2 Tax=Gemmatimonas aurantiaca TaxID=173480 RepID=C1AD88_GEMAT|nr:hypothetical protein [Gemmatimonas aurantiaca]BAH40465.1 hypothetical protein GAU_3423 [Gemmatimonas aurantiaca T-27]HCT56508.1 hypothetical protein [Gemmatimonas aurantiaca]
MNRGSQDGNDRASWAVLLQEATPEEIENLEFFDDLADRIRAVRAPDTGGANLGAPGRAVAAVTVLSGSATAQVLLDQVAPLLPGVIQELMPVPARQQCLDALWALSYLNAAQCAGSDAPTEQQAAEIAWLPTLVASLGQFSESEQQTIALAAAACRQVSLVPSVFGLAALPTFTPGATFGFNVQGFALHIAAAIESRAPYEDVEMAWLDFVHGFPIKLDTGTLDWPALLWAARAVYATIGGIPVAEVGDELHALVANA